MVVKDEISQAGATSIAEQTGEPVRGLEPKEATGAERRRHPRFSVEGEAEIVVRNGASLFRGRILNISEAGCYIQTLAYVQLARCTQVDILFVVSGKIVSVSAEARTSTPKVGIGFQFLSVDNKTRAVLKTILSSLRLQQPA